MITKISGTVIKGRGVGRQLGFATANLKLTKNISLPDFGVYSGVASVAGLKYPAAIFIGPPATFDLPDPVVEAHLLDFNQDIYDQEIELYLDHKIREVKKFDSLEELKIQIEKDVEQVRELVAK